MSTSTVKVTQLFVSFHLPKFTEAMASLKGVVPFEAITRISQSVLDFKKQTASEEITEVAAIPFNIVDRLNRVTVVYSKTFNAFGIELKADSAFQLPANEALIVDDNKAYLHV